MKRCTSNPSGASIASNASNTGPRAGVTLSQAISRSARLTTSLEFPIAHGVDEGPTTFQPETAAMPKIDLDAIPQTNRTGYPDPFDRGGRRAAGTAASRPPPG